MHLSFAVKGVPIRETCYLPPPELGRGGGLMSWWPHLCQVVLQALDEESGSVLVFLPGQREIVQLAKALSAAISGNDPGMQSGDSPVWRPALGATAGRPLLRRCRE